MIGKDLLDFAVLEKRGYPETKEEWWAWCNYHKENLRWLVANYHPVYLSEGFSHEGLPITTPGAEAICDIVREAVKEETVNDPLDCFDQFLEQRSGGMVTLLNQVWFGVPESRDAHSLPGFGILCDLCSESYCLEDES